MSTLDPRRVIEAKPNTWLFDAEENLRNLKESGASESAIKVAEEEVRHHKLACYEFALEMITERMI